MAVGCAWWHKRNRSQFKNRCAHVHPHAAIGIHRGRDHAGLGQHLYGFFLRQAVIDHIAGKATRAVAALLDLAAIGVVNHIFKICALAPSAHAQDLVGAHAKAAIGQKAVVALAQTQQPLGFIQHDKIVARALHFAKVDFHSAIIGSLCRPPPAPSKMG